jgi:hypothetical protein
MAGLPMPGAVAAAQDPYAFSAQAPVQRNLGVLPVANLAATLEMNRKASTQAFEQQQSLPVIQGLAAHIDAAWADAKEAKLVVEQEMIEAMLARRGEYTTQKRQQIAEQKQPEIYMLVASAKMRQVESLLRDVLIGTGAEKPWTLAPTPDPELPPEIRQELMGKLAMEIQQALMMGFPPLLEAARERAKQLVDEVRPLLMEEAQRRTERMEVKMEDQQVEGGFLHALDQFTTDLATFKTAFVGGPVIRRKPKLTWGQGGSMIVETADKMEWDRLDPFDVYPARYARNLQDGPLIVKRRLSRMNLTEMIGVEGYSEPAIRAVLDRFGDSGLREWLSIDSAKASAEGKQTLISTEAGQIDALQFWGSASGKMLREWGLDETEVPDESKEYLIEAWKIGPYVIKAVLNADPLGRRPVFGTSFQLQPGSVWGHSPYDLCRDCQDMCNAAARSLAANLGIASGPQVAILSNRLPAGEDVTEMFPWKIWQFESDPMGSTADPIKFFQPSSHAAELMTVFERFSILADEAVGIPRYMAGFNEGSGGAGRTASGMSMMIGNASKVVKQVLGNVDANILIPVLEAQYYYNMRYGTDPDLKGDVKPLARGAMSVAVKEAAQVRMNEFLQVALNSPVVQQIVGMEGFAELLRPTVKRLDVNPDRVIPSNAVLRQRLAQQAAQQMLMAQMAGAQEGAPGESAPGGTPKKPEQGGERLMNGAPTTDNFSPTPRG